MDSLIDKTIINEYTFERIKDFTDDYFWDNMTYDHFISWNKECFTLLNDSTKEWIIELCTKINKKEINLVDEETTSEMTACAIYFNGKRKLCIVNPR